MTKQKTLLSYLTLIEQLKDIKFLAIGIKVDHTWRYYIVKNESTALPWYASCLVNKEDFLSSFAQDIKGIGISLGSNINHLQSLQKSIDPDFYYILSECDCTYMFSWQEND